MHRYVVIDAFASEPLQGNPVAVFFDCDDLSGERMQRMAREMNLSESTFVLRPQQDGDARIRIFTPVNELPFAGHPLLGTAIALGAETDKDRLFLETRMGTVPFALERQDGKVVACSMQQPIPTWEHFSRPAELLAALGLKGSTFPIEVYRNGPRHVFVGLESVAALSALHPDHRALCDFPDLAVNCFAGAGRHWRSRMFSPAYGVVEDAATGSAAGPLAIHLARHRQIPYGQQIEILQGVEIGRPSRMYARAEGAGERVSAVEVSGNGAAFAEGRAYLCTGRTEERHDGRQREHFRVPHRDHRSPFPGVRGAAGEPHGGAAQLAGTRPPLWRARAAGTGPGHGRRAGPAVDADRGDRRAGRARGGVRHPRR